MAVFNKFNCFVQDCANGVHNLSTASLKVMLTNTAPLATNTIKANLAEIAAGNGYAAGGNVAAFVSGADTSGLYRLILAIIAFTAAGGNFAPFEYAVLYDSSTANGNLIGWWDYGAAIILTNGNTFTVATDQVNGVFTVQ